MPGAESLQRRNADHAARDGADRRSGEIDEFLAAARRELAREASHGPGERWPRRKQKTGNQECNEKFDRSRACVGGDVQQRASDRLEMGRDPGQRLAKIARSQIPELVDRLADQRPGLDCVGRPRQDQRRQVEARGQRADAVDQAQHQPRCGADHDQEADEREQHGRQPPPSAQVPHHPVVGRIKRNGQHNGPDGNGDEWTDQGEGQVEQQSEDSEPDGHLDPGRCRVSAAVRIVAGARHGFVSPLPHDTLAIVRL